MTKIPGEITPWPGATSSEIQQEYVDTCAVKSQQIIMKTFGIDIPESELVAESANKGYYMPGCGSDPDQVGKLLNDHGIATTPHENANVYDLVGELAQGHKVIVGVDADELWQPSWYNDIFGEQANHALVVTGIDTTDPENVKVIVTDPGTGDVAKEYPLEQFIDAWHDSNCFYVTTNAPAPKGSDGMSGFDYEVGHLPFVCNIPFDSYMPLVNQYDIFHDDIMKNMQQCLSDLNDGEDMPVQGFHDAFDHMNSVQKMMQDAWDDTVQAHSVNINDHLLNDHWDWNTFKSDLPDYIDLSGYDAI